MKEEIETHPRESDKDVQQRRMTDRGTDPGTSEPGNPPRETDVERSDRIGPPGTTQVGENLEGAPTEDSPAREPTEKIERMQEASRDEEDVERERP